MKIGFLITARLKSTRLPEKLILKIYGREMIRHMIDRLKLSEALDQIIICTSPNPQDKPLVNIANEEGIKYFLGDEDDVIQRLSDAAEFFKLDFAINISADNPLVSIKYIERIREEFENTNADHIRCMDLPIGLFSYGLKPAALKEVCKIKKSKQTEVWGRYFTETGLFEVRDLVVDDNHKRNYRMTLDYPEDFELFEAIFSHFGEETYKTNIDDILQFLDENPDIAAINMDCQKKYEERLSKQRELAK
ncbi:MAG: 3-deoxy-manno-octulosonate cytidylyltransferase [Asgard group archaeon]|nr:3-deoxy-manno-octulosonate cytidylyltransferase [Asgard group archaeon]